MKQITLLILLLAGQFAFSQKKIYCDDKGDVVSKKNATCYKILSKNDDKTWHTQQFYISGKLQYEGQSAKKDGSGKIGVHTSYYPSGSLRCKAHYKNRKLSLSEAFYESSNIKQKSVYKDGIVTKVHTYYDLGQLKNEVQFSGPKENRTIKAKSYHSNGKLKRDDEYIEKSSGKRKYKLLKGICLSEDGREVDHTPFMRFPEFPGGPEMLKAYISANLRYPRQCLKHKPQGRVFVKFTVDKKGKITRIRVVKSVDSLLDKEAVRVVNNMPDWIPGIRYGEFVNTSFCLPIKFALQ